MRFPSALIVLGGLATGTVVAQYPNRPFTRPVAPAKDSLDRLNLTQAWLVHVPTDGPRDGIESVQHLGNQIIVQTRRGDIVSLDPKTGAMHWRTAIGNPFHVTHEVGFNDQLILVTGGTRVYGLDRASGEQVWVADLPASPSSPPTADADGFYICLSNGRLAAYAFPLELGKPAAVKASTVETHISKGTPPPWTYNERHVAGSGFNQGRTAMGNDAIHNRRAAIGSAADIGKRPPLGQIDIKRNERGQLVVQGPKMRWEYATHRRIQDRPVLSSQSVLVVSTDRYAIIIDKKHGYTSFELPAGDAISAPVGHYGEIAYVADRNGTVYCYDLAARALRWTYSASNTSTIRTQPRATDEDLYVDADNGGLIRLNRITGAPHWQAPDAYRYLSSNRKYVYAADKHHQLLVLDRVRGTVLARYDLSGFPIPVANDATDRVLLAAEDGSILCLHDRAYPMPMMLRAAEPRIAQSTETVKKPVEKDVPLPADRPAATPSEQPEPKPAPAPAPKPKVEPKPKPAKPTPKGKT